MKAVMPQFELDGVKNVWIVKPGAKSRGRGLCNVVFSSPVYQVLKICFCDCVVSIILWLLSRLQQLPYLHSGGHIFSVIFLKPVQSICLNNFCNFYEIESVWVKKVDHKDKSYKVHVATFSVTYSLNLVSMFVQIRS